VKRFETSKSRPGRHSLPNTSNSEDPPEMHTMAAGNAWSLSLYFGHPYPSQIFPQSYFIQITDQPRPKFVLRDSKPEKVPNFSLTWCYWLTDNLRHFLCTLDQSLWGVEKQEHVYCVLTFKTNGIVHTQSVPRSKHTPSQLYKPVS